MAVSNAQRATEWLATLEAGAQRAGLSGESVSGEIAAGIAQTYALLALRETLVRNNEMLCVSIDDLCEQLREAIGKVPGAMP